MACERPSSIIRAIWSPSSTIALASSSFSGLSSSTIVPSFLAMSRGVSLVRSPILRARTSTVLGGSWKVWRWLFGRLADNSYLIFQGEQPNLRHHDEPYISCLAPVDCGRNGFVETCPHGHQSKEAKLLLFMLLNNKEVGGGWTKHHWEVGGVEIEFVVNRKAGIVEGKMCQSKNYLAISCARQTANGKRHQTKDLKIVRC